MKLTFQSKGSTSKFNKRNLSDFLRTAVNDVNEKFSMCGILAAIQAGIDVPCTESTVSTELYEGLGILQHRGQVGGLRGGWTDTGGCCSWPRLINRITTISFQDAAGIITCASKGRFYQCKGNGMVRDVFDQGKLLALRGWMGLSHGNCIMCAANRVFELRYTPT